MFSLMWIQNGTIFALIICLLRLLYRGYYSPDSCYGFYWKERIFLQLLWFVINSVMICLSPSSFNLLFLYVYFPYLPVIISYYHSQILSVHALVFPSYVSMFLCDLSASMPESVSLTPGISGFLVFSETSFASRFLEFPAAVLRHFYPRLISSFEN